MRAGKQEGRDEHRLECAHGSSSWTAKEEGARHLHPLFSLKRPASTVFLSIVGPVRFMTYIVFGYGSLIWK